MVDVLPPPTLFDPTLVSATDELLGSARLWSLAVEHTGVVCTVPDLCRDVLWLTEGPPVVLDRTVEPILTPVVAGTTIHGVRFGPAVTRIHLDRSWTGWAQAAVLGRPTILRQAMSNGALVGVVDTTLGRMLHLLDRPAVRIPHVATELGLSERQLLRVANAGLGLAPKQVQRRLRVQRFATADDSRRLTDRAVDAGFYDQAHAANEIRALTGLGAAALARLVVAESSKTERRSQVDDGRPSKRGVHDEVRVRDRLRP